MSVEEQVEDEFARSAAPDHATREAWTLRGEWRGEGGVEGRGAEPTDAAHVFYLHPTTAPGPDWFADPLAPAQVEAVDRVTEQHLVAFPGRVWAPRYRQTTTRAFFELDHGGALAYDLAYRDVVRAFAQFLVDDARLALTEPGPPRPLVLAGHSQGARHVMQLVREFFDHEGLASRLVAVYPIGIGVAEDEPVLTRFPAAGDPDSSGVVVCFRATLEQGAKPVMPGVCLNPLTCSVHLPEAPASWHLPVEATHDGPLAGVRVAARVRGDFVFVDPAVPGALDAVALPDGGLHRVELQLFARNLREDVRRRVAAWRHRQAEQAARQPAPEGALVPADGTGAVERWPGVRGSSLRVAGGWLHHVDLSPATTTHGGPEATPVVLLHKLGGWVADWRTVAPALARSRRVVVVDLPGHGASHVDAPAGWIAWPADLATRVVTLLDHLGLERVHLVGASLGGVVAVHLAASQPERVAGLGLVGTSLTAALSSARTLELDQSSRDAYAPGWIPLPGHVGRAATDDPVVLADLDASRARAGAWVRACERGVGLAGVAHLLRDVASPVLLLNGERAGYRSYEQAARDAWPDVRVEVVPGAGAFPHQEQGAVVATLVEDFLTAVDTAGDTAGGPACG